MVLLPEGEVVAHILYPHIHIHHRREQFITTNMATIKAKAGNANKRMVIISRTATIPFSSPLPGLVLRLFGYALCELRYMAAKETNSWPPAPHLSFDYLIYFLANVAMKPAHKKVPNMDSIIATAWYSGRSL